MPAESHSTDLFTIPRGILTVALWSGGTPGAYYDIGNVLNCELELNVERAERRSGRQPGRIVLKRRVIEKGYKLTMELDEYSQKNLVKFLMGTVASGKINALTDIDNEYSLKLVENNDDGPNKIWEFHKGYFSPNGTIALIGEDYVPLPVMFEGLDDSDNHATSPLFDCYYSSTTTTAA